MSFLSLGPSDGLYYEYVQASSKTCVTFVFFNAITSDTTAWEAEIGPKLREQGHGTLSFNYRGQTDSPFSPDLTLDEKLIIDDAIALLRNLQPQNPVLVGLSIGGLFAAKTHLAGAIPGSGLVLINTLRQDGPRLRWIGDALVRAVSVGGLGLFRDLFLPLLMNEEWQQQNRQSFLKEPPDYTPLAKNHGHYKLLSAAGRSSDWDLPYEQLDLPTLIITGLQDHVFLERDVVERLSRRIPKMKRVDCDEAGHLLPAEIPERLVSELVVFAKEV